MDKDYIHLNGLEDYGLPDILPGTANELISVNNSESGYVLIPKENVIPDPISAKQILNSTNVNEWDWTNDPKSVSITADTGNGNGFKFDQTTSRMIHELNTTKIINQGVERVLCTTTGVDLKGNVSVDNFITVPQGSSFGIGLGTTLTRTDFGSSAINLRIANTLRCQVSTSGISVTGGISQNNAINTNSFYGNSTFSNGTFTLDQNMNVLTTSSINLVNGNVISTGGQINGNNIKASNAGTAILAAVRVVDDNTGLYQSTTGNLDLCASGTQALNINSNRVQNNITFLFNRCPAFSVGEYILAQAYSIFSSSTPLLLIKTPTTGNIDMEFGTATSYFGGQQFQIIVRDTGAGTARYRAQSTTYHVTGGAAIVTIATNTYHTFVKDRYHILICNIDSNSFYLMQT